MSDEPKKKRKKATSNTVRTMAWLKERGIVHQKVEQWVPGAMVRRDLFGGIDIVAIGVVDAGVRSREVTFSDRVFTAMTSACPATLRKGVTGYQCCTDNGSVEKHRQKLLAEPRLRLWVECGNRLFIHGWGHRAMPRQPGAKRVGVRRKVWTLREVELTLADFDNKASDTTANVGMILGKEQ